MSEHDEPTPAPKKPRAPRTYHKRPCNVDQLLKQKKATELRAAGHTYQSIGDELGLTVSGAQALLGKSIPKLQNEVRENIIKLHEGEIAKVKEVLDLIVSDMMRLREIWQADVEAGAEHSPKVPSFVPYFRAVDATIAAAGKYAPLLERTAKLYGLDAPKEVHVSLVGEVQGFLRLLHVVLFRALAATPDAPELVSNIIAELTHEIEAAHIGGVGDGEGEGADDGGEDEGGLDGTRREVIETERLDGPDAGESETGETPTP